MKPFIYILLAGALAGCASSNSHSLTQETNPAIERARTALAGKYAFSTADLNITLKLHPIGTYYLWIEKWGGVRTEETGAWELANREVVLHSTNGQIAFPIHRLRLGRADDGHELLFVLDDHNNIVWSDLSLRREQ
jgi:hypothetical protein